MFSNTLRRIDWQLILPASVLILISLITLFSINPIFFRNQFIFVLISVAVFILFSQVDIRQFFYLQKPLYFFSLILLVILIFIGAAERGAVRWLGFFGFGIQFSEILKPFCILILASFLSSENSTSFKTFSKILIFLAPLAFLIYRQPDLGSAMIYVLTVLMTLFLYGFPFWWFGIGIAAILGMLPVVWKFLHEYQKQRVLTFLHLTNDPLGNSYNAIQAVIAVGSGMLTGKGIGQGTQSMLRFLPEKQTDFIFATISEDLGFVGSILLIGIFSLLLYRIFVVFYKTDDIYYKVIAGSSFSLIFIQFFINIGMNIGILPIVGVPLPFISYGGSSLVSNAVILGIVSQISKATRFSSALEIK